MTRLTLLRERNQPTHRSNSPRHSDDSLERDTPTKLELHRVFRRNDEEVVESVGDGVDEEGVIVERHEVNGSWERDRGDVRSGSESVVARVESDLKGTKKESATRRGGERGRRRDQKTHRKLLPFLNTSNQHVQKPNHSTSNSEVLLPLSHLE